MHSESKANLNPVGLSPVYGVKLNLKEAVEGLLGYLKKHVFEKRWINE